MLRRLALAIFALSTLLGACGGKYISSDILEDDLKVRSTTSSDAIIVVMEAYRQALRDLDVDAVQRLLSEAYYENAGTTDTTVDDYGAEGVLELLRRIDEHVEELRVEVTVRDVQIDDDLADVFFEYTFRARYMIDDQAHWTTERDVNRIQMQLEDSGWRILSGL